VTNWDFGIALMEAAKGKFARKIVVRVQHYTRMEFGRHFAQKRG
jgi:hypothetical protein